MVKTHKGFFKPKNPEKYKGNPTNIVYRSSWELKFMIWCDNTAAVTQWSSEEIVIPYKSPLDGKWHRYFPDFYIVTKEGTKLIEIKPHKETQQPDPQKYKTKKRFLTESITFAKNMAKWKAAEEYCADRKWKFVTMTEKELGIGRK